MRTGRQLNVKNSWSLIPGTTKKRGSNTKNKITVISVTQLTRSDRLMVGLRKKLLALNWENGKTVQIERETEARAYLEAVPHTGGKVRGIVIPDNFLT